MKPTFKRWCSATISSIFPSPRDGTKLFLLVGGEGRVQCCFLCGTVQTADFFFGKSPFLTIQFLPQFDFGHEASKIGIFDHLILKTIHNWPLGSFDEWF
jgi:hypothetical protein